DRGGAGRARREPGRRAEVGALRRRHERPRRARARPSRARARGGAGERVAIAHEALLTGWPALVSARLAAMDRIAFRERLREAAGAWERAGHHRDFVWRGSVLAELDEHAEWLAGGLSSVEEEFVRQSRRAARRTRARQAGVAIAVVAAVLGGVFL